MNTEQSPPSLVDRSGWPIGERVRALEVEMTNTQNDLHNFTSMLQNQAQEFDKIKTRITFATGAILGISVVLKILPPEMGTVLKHLFGA